MSYRMLNRYTVINFRQIDFLQYSIAYGEWKNS
jgi:hypothetical protein